MLSGRFANARAQIAGQANLHGDLAVSQFFDQVRILRGAEAVTDALGMKIQRSPDGLGRSGFPGVGGQAHAMILSVRVNAAKKFWRSFDFVASDAHSYNMAILVVD